MFFSKNSKKGTTVAEVLIASAILGISVAMIASALNDINKNRQKSLGLGQRDRLVHGIIENVRESVDKLQINFNHSGSFSDDMLWADKVLEPANMGYAWSNSFVGLASQCTACPGKYDYVVQPMDGTQGLFLVTLRMVNQSLFEGVREYRFIARSR